MRSCVYMRAMCLLCKWIFKTIPVEAKGHLQCWSSGAMQHYIFFSFETRSLIVLDVTKVYRTTGHPTLWPSCLGHLSIKITCVPHLFFGFLFCFLGIKLRSLGLVRWLMVKSVYCSSRGLNLNPWTHIRQLITVCNFSSMATLNTCTYVYIFPHRNIYRI